MLTHLHLVVYTWWCWHICKGGGVPRVEMGVGSRDSALLRKLSAYFLLRRWKVWRSHGSSPDALRGGTGRWPLASGVLLGLSRVHQTHRSDPIFYNLAFFRRNFSFGPLENLNSVLDPGSRRHASWHRGYTSRRHGSRRRAPWPSPAWRPTWQRGRRHRSRRRAFNYKPA